MTKKTERSNAVRKKMKKINLCIFYETIDEPWGGVNSFMRGLKKEFEGYPELEIVSHREADILLISSAFIARGKMLQRHNVKNILGGRPINSFIGYFAGSKKKKLIHRLDGLGRLYGRMDDMDDRQIMVNGFADYTIFQSVFCEESFINVPVIPRRYTVIGNGADSDYFSLKSDFSLRDKVRIVAVSWSQNPMKGHETIKNMSYLDDVEMTFVGMWPGAIDRGKVKVLGVMSPRELGNELKKHDLFLHAAKNDPCPNVVYEALATGLPVIYHTTGGSPEICGHGRYGVALKDDLGKSLREITGRYRELVNAIRDDYRKFTISCASEKYFEVIREVANN